MDPLSQIRLRSTWTGDTSYCQGPHNVFTLTLLSVGSGSAGQETWAPLVQRQKAPAYLEVGKMPALLGFSF